jgi:hypothetical protein
MAFSGPLRCYPHSAGVERLGWRSDAARTEPHGMWLVPSGHPHLFLWPLVSNHSRCFVLLLPSRRTFPRSHFMSMWPPHSLQTGLFRNMNRIGLNVLLYLFCKVWSWLDSVGIPEFGFCQEVIHADLYKLVVPELSCSNISAHWLVSGISCVCISRIWAQGLALARQALYHLSHTSSLFKVIFQIGSCFLLPRQGTMILQHMASHVAGITDVRHHTWP